MVGQPSSSVTTDSDLLTLKQVKVVVGSCHKSLIGTLQPVASKKKLKTKKQKKNKQKKLKKKTKNKKK